MTERLGLRRVVSYVLLAISAITIIGNEKLAGAHDLFALVSIVCLIAGAGLFFWVRNRERATRPSLPPVRRFDRMDFTGGRRPPSVDVERDKQENDREV